MLDDTNFNLQGQRVTVLGGTGFVGRHLCYALVTAGAQVTVLTRNPNRHRALEVLPSLELVGAQISHQPTLMQYFKDADVVVNLIGILNEKGHRGEGFYKIHSALAKMVIAACDENQVGQLLHMSALGVSAQEKLSFYLHSKGLAESWVHQHKKGVTQVTSFRPSIIYGPGDSFFNRFARMLKMSVGVLPLPAWQAVFYPIYVGDVVFAMMSSVDNKESFGESYELCGPEKYQLYDLVDYTRKLLKKRTFILKVPNKMSRLMASFMEYLPGKPYSLDNWRSTQIDAVCRRSYESLFHRRPKKITTVVPDYIGPHALLTVYDKYRRTH